MCTQTFIDTKPPWENTITHRVRDHSYVNNNPWLVLHYCSIFYSFQIGNLRALCFCLSLLVRHKFLDIKHGLAVSKLSLTRHEWEKRGLELLSPLVEAIDFQATYALFVCTDTLECKPVKCEVLHLSPTGPCLIFFGLLSTQTRARVHKIQSGHFANQI